jgi:hypothetical protein
MGRALHARRHRVSVIHDYAEKWILRRELVRRQYYMWMNRGDRWKVVNSGGNARKKSPVGEGGDFAVLQSHCGGDLDRRG